MSWEKTDIRCAHCGVEMVRVLWGCGLGHPVYADHGYGPVSAIHYCEESGGRDGLKVEGVLLVRDEEAE